MRHNKLTERARVPRAQVFRAFQALLVPLAPLGVVREEGWACRRALRARRAARLARLRGLAVRPPLGNENDCARRCHGSS